MKNKKTTMIAVIRIIRWIKTDVCFLCLFYERRENEKQKNNNDCCDCSYCMSVLRKERK